MPWTELRVTEVGGWGRGGGGRRRDRSGRNRRQQMLTKIYSFLIAFRTFTVQTVSPVVGGVLYLNM